ncbi:hypothetical protein C8R47DRAFT_1220056 [Mycena vitilis]|nr:hypothetical protein C8R47DRAFT_1220056 [Mycena vitilis]
MEQFQPPGTVIHYLKHKFLRTEIHLGWDPCPVKVIAPALWRRDMDGNHGACWVLKGSKLDGMYVNRMQRNEVLLPNTEITERACVEHGLYVHYVECLKHHAHCVICNSHETTFFRLRDETSSSNYGLDPISDSEPSDTSSHDSPRAATDDSGSDATRRISESSLESSSQRSSPCSERLFSERESGSDSETDCEAEPASASDSEASVRSSTSATSGNWGREPWDMEEPVKRSTPQYLIDVKDGEWDAFIGEILSKATTPERDRDRCLPKSSAD